MEQLSAFFTPNLEQISDDEWAQFFKEMDRYHFIRFKNFKVTLKVQNPYYTVERYSVAEGQQGYQSDCFDYEYLNTYQVHSVNSLLNDFLDSSDWFTMPHVKHATGSKSISHHVKTPNVANADSWYLPNEFFPSYDVNKPPTYDLADISASQLGMVKTVAARQFPSQFHVAVTGWPLIILPNQRQPQGAGESRNAGAMITVYMEWCFEAKEIKRLPNTVE